MKQPLQIETCRRNVIGIVVCPELMIRVKPCPGEFVQGDQRQLPVTFPEPEVKIDVKLAKIDQGRNDGNGSCHPEINMEVKIYKRTEKEYKL